MNNQHQGLLPIDIFKLEAANKVLWLEAVSNLDAAKAKITQLMKVSSCDYLILNQNTRHTEIVGHERAVAADLKDPFRGVK
jgi:hypothetical protein